MLGARSAAGGAAWGAGRVVAVGAPESPRLELCRAFGAEATVCLDDHPEPAQRIGAIREIVG